MNPRHAAILERFEEVSRALADPDVATVPARLAELGREFAHLQEQVDLIRALNLLAEEIDATRELAADDSDAEMADLAREELAELEGRQPGLEQRLRRLLLPSDPHDDRNVILEVRAGAGGDEAALFAGDLVRMYTRFADRRGWKVETLGSTITDRGGFKEAILEVRGKGAFSRLKYESGVHRVQRVPSTESSGRLHTSAASVVVLPEAEAIDVDIADDEVRVDVYRSSGHGGQSVNTTDSAVRITHLETGIIVTIQDEKSQHKNRAKALAILRARLLDLERQKQDEARGDARRSQIGGGDRSAKMRTYNFPQDRITDHRIKKSIHGIESFLDGVIDDLVGALIEADEAEKLVAADA